MILTKGGVLFAIEPTRSPAQRRVQLLEVVSGGDQEQPIIADEAVHLIEEEGAVLVVDERVEVLEDEHAGCHFARLLEDGAHAVFFAHAVLERLDVEGCIPSGVAILHDRLHAYRLPVACVAVRRLLRHKPKIENTHQEDLPL